MHGVARANLAAVQHLGKNTLSGHDALTHGVEYLAVAMTFLANLVTPEQHVIARNTRSHRQGGKINAVHHQIFAKTAVGHNRPTGFTPATKADLPACASCRVAFDAVIFNNIGIIHAGPCLFSDWREIATILPIILFLACKTLLLHLCGHRSLPQMRRVQLGHFAAVVSAYYCCQPLPPPNASILLC